MIRSAHTLYQARTVLTAHFGYPSFRATQLRVLQPLLAGRHVLAVLPTGAGKSLCYQVPALLAGALTVVVSPLISLMQDQVASLRRRNIAAAYLNSTLSKEDQRTILDLALGGTARLLYCAPERLASLSRLVRDSGVHVPLLAIDEAHCIVEWGNAFRPVYRQLGEFRYHLREPQTLALTGSATPDAQREILDVLRIPRADVVTASFDRPNLRFAVARVKNDRERFARIVREVEAARGQVIIYAPTRRITELIARALRFRGIRAAPYHAGLDTEIRRPVLSAFLHDRAPVIVATSAFGMGIDKPDVRLVLHWGPPRTLEAYYQEAGRAGRDRRPSLCLVLWRREDLAWSDLSPGIRHYVERRRCRRRQLLEHFGERLEACSGCDVCG